MLCQDALVQVVHRPIGVARSSLELTDFEQPLVALVCYLTNESVWTVWDCWHELIHTLRRGQLPWSPTATKPGVVPPRTSCEAGRVASRLDLKLLEDGAEVLLGVSDVAPELLVWDPVFAASFGNPGHGTVSRSAASASV